MAQKHFILAIDLGSGGPKIALVSSDGEIACAARATNQLIFLPDGGVEQDPNEWWSVIRAGVQEVLQQAVAPVDDIVALTLAGQWSVTVPVDASGQAIGNAIHWMDLRGARYTKRLMDGWPRVSGYGALPLYQWMRLTGGAPTPSGSDALAKMLFLKHERPEVYRQAYKFLEPVDYLGARLTGRFAMSYASAFPYLLTDNRDCRAVRYSDKLIQKAQLDSSKLPDLVPVDTVLGTIRPQIADEWGLSRNTKVMIGSGDSHAALVGSGAVENGQTHICIGTSSWITCLLNERRIDLLREIASMPSIVPGRFMVVAEQGPAGKLLQMFVERWFSGGIPADQYDQRYSELLSLAAKIPVGSHGVRFLPWLNGSGPPAPDARMRGGFLNLSLTSGPGEAVRSILEGVAFNLRWLNGHVERLAQRSRPGSLRFIGGGARSPLWCQIIADVFGRTILQVKDPHMSLARGAAIAGFAGLKLVNITDAARLVPIAQTFEPDPKRHAQYDEKYREFLRMYHAVRPMMHRWGKDRT